MEIVLGRRKPWRQVLSKEQLKPKYHHSLSLGQIELFAFEIAHFRGSEIIEPRDTLGGVYVASIEYQRLNAYWKDWRSLEELAFDECGVTGPRIPYWLPPLDPRKIPRKGFYRPFGWKEKSSELKMVYSTAEELTNSHPVGRVNSLPVLTTEHVLLAMLRHSELEICQKLVASGIDHRRIEAALKDPRGLR